MVSHELVYCTQIAYDRCPAKGTSPGHHPKMLRRAARRSYSNRVQSNVLKETLLPRPRSSPCPTRRGNLEGDRGLGGRVAGPQDGDSEFTLARGTRARRR